MTTPPYRNELDTLEARKRALENELESIQDRINTRKRLPMLDQVKVATPCTANWDDMVGDDRKRFCLSCDKNVFNISALPREEAEKFLAEQAASQGEVCVRFYQRADGTIMTSDCSVGVARKRRKKIALSVAGAGVLAFGAATAFVQQKSQVMGKMEPIEAYAPPQPTTVVDPSPNPLGQWVAGGMMMEPTVTPSAQPVPTPPKPEVVRPKPPHAVRAR